MFGPVWTFGSLWHVQQISYQWKPLWSWREWLAFLSLQIRDSNDKAGSEKPKQKVCEAGELLKRHGQWALQIGLLQIQTSLIYIEKSASLINASAEPLVHVD